MTLYATGTTGTIGKHLISHTESISIDLVSAIEEFDKLRFIANSCIIHLAGIVGADQVAADLKNSFKVNVDGSIKLAKVSLAQNVEKFIYISTSHIYKPSINKLSEKSISSPSNYYAQQKLLTELELKKIFVNHKDKLCIVRVFSVLDWDVANYTLGGGVMKLVRNEREYKLKDSNDIRDFLTPKKVAEVLLKIAQHPKLSGEINLSSGVGTSIKDAVNQMVHESNLLVNTENILSGNSKNPYSVGDNSRLTSYFPDIDLKWKPSKFIFG